MEDVLAGVQESLVAREREVRFLVSLLHFGWDGRAPNVMVWGPPESGKTALVRAVVDARGGTFAWLTCISSQKDTDMFNSILMQLSGSKRTRKNGYCAEKVVASASDFLAQLPEVCSPKQSATIVIDNAHQIASSSMLYLFLKARELANANVSIILISRVAWGSGAFGSNLPAPMMLHLRSYSNDQICEILGKKVREVLALPSQSRGDLFSCIMGPLLRRTKSMRLLHKAVGCLAEKYWEPVVNGEVSENDPGALGTKIRKHVTRMVSSMDGGILDISIQVAPPNCDEEEDIKNDLDVHNQAGLDTTGLTFECKLLLLSAFICSSNKSDSDRLVFDPTYRSRKRRSHLSGNKQVEAAHALRLSGPIAFHLERLLAVFRYLSRQIIVEDMVGEEDGETEEDLMNMYSGKIMTQIRSLVSMKLMSQVSGDLLEGSKFQCQIPKELAKKIAENLKLELSDYMNFS